MLEEIQEQEYETLSSEAAVKEAQENGGEVVFPTEFELQLDLDSDQAVDVFKANLPVLEQHLKVKHWGIAPSRSPGKYHVTLEMIQPLQSNMERILLQACLGSDPKRELLSYARVMKRDQHPTLFIEGGTKPEEKKEPITEFSKAFPNIVSLKPFEEVGPGDKGGDFVGCSGTVLKTGTYNELRNYDTTGACAELDPMLTRYMVAVETEDGDKLLYTYGPDGFGVYV